MRIPRAHRRNLPLFGWAEVPIWALVSGIPCQKQMAARDRAPEK